MARNGWVALAAFALATVAVGVFYERTAGSGKSEACSASSQALAGKLAPLVGGDIASLRIRPRRAPDLSFQGANGAQMTLADFKGRALVLNLWATWCVPCRGEMPDLDKLQAAAGGRNFEVVAIDVDTSHPERAGPFLDGAGVETLARYADPSGDVMEKLRLSGDLLGLPTTLLVDAEGCEIGLVAGAAKWNSADARAAAKVLAGG